MIKGESDPVYRRLYSKFKALADKARDILIANSGGINYIETTPIIEFEQQNNTEVVIKWTAEKVNDNRIKPARRYAYFILDGKKIKASVNKIITKEEETQKELLAISSCRGRNDEPFWLIHKKDKNRVQNLLVCEFFAGNVYYFEPFYFLLVGAFAANVHHQLIVIDLLFFSRGKIDPTFEIAVPIEHKLATKKRANADCTLLTVKKFVCTILIFPSCRSRR